MTALNGLPPDASLDADLAFALELSARVSDVALTHFRRGVTARMKPDDTPVTQADIDVEAMIRVALAEARPDDGILGEEQGASGDARRVWVIDPIDGTKNFAAAIPVWATLLALTIDGVPVLGVVAAPALAEMYAGRRGGGATLNGRPIQVSGAGEIESAFLLDGGVDELLRSAWGSRYLDLAQEVRRTRGFGDFWSHVLVARGAADAALEPSLRIWDYAAPQAIVEAAGGLFTQIDGSPTRDGGSVLASNGRIHDDLVRRLTP